MEITEEQYRRIEPVLPRQRGNVSMSNLTVLNAILYVAEQGCKWRGADTTHRELAHHRHPHEPLVQERRAGRSVEKLQREQLVSIRSGGGFDGPRTS